MKTRTVSLLSFLLCSLLIVSHVPGQDESESETQSGSESGGFEFDQDIEFDMDEFEGFTEGEFGAAELSEEEQAAAAVIGTTMLLAILACVFVGLILTGIVAYLLSDALNAIPESHREISPVIPWLLFVPVVHIVIMFLAFIKVPDSLKGYLDSVGQHPPDDCGKALGLWGSVASVIGCIFPVGLILLWMSLMKIGQAKQAARSIAATGAGQ